MAKRLGWLGVLAALCGGTIAVGCISDGDQGPPGPEGPAGTDFTQSISAVIPNQAFIARTLDVAISGWGTVWAEGAVTVNFGEGVTVNELVVASRTALVANITIEATAPTGLRDVIVEGGAAEPLTYVGAFSVDSPYELVVDGTAAQGSIFFASAKSLDLLAPFDTTTAGDGFFTPISYPNVSVNAPAGIDADISSVQLYAVEMLMLADVNGPSGPQDIDVVSGPEGNETLFPGPGALDLAERTATDITLGQIESGSVDMPYGSVLYRVNVPSGGRKMLTLRATAMSASASPSFAVLPDSGSFADMMAFAPSTSLITPQAGLSLYLVYWDNSGTADYNFNILSSAADVAVAAETEPNNDIAHAEQPASLGFVLDPAKISSLTDEDWIEITATAGDVGKQIHVVTMPGDDYCDTVVEVFEGDGTTTLGGTSANANYHEDHTSAAIPSAGTYYVKISADQSGWYDSSAPNYMGFVELVGP
jgi:hypothetical protein